MCIYIAVCISVRAVPECPFLPECQHLSRDVKISPRISKCVLMPIPSPATHTIYTKRIRKVTKLILTITINIYIYIYTRKQNTCSIYRCADRHRVRYTQIDRQTNRKSDTQTGGPDRQTDRQADRQAGRQAGRHRQAQARQAHRHR